MNVGCGGNAETSEDRRRSRKREGKEGRRRVNCVLG